MTRPFAPTALMLGNFVTGISVLAPAGMLVELADAFQVSIRDAGLLITYGAIVLCIGSPLTAWLTSRIDRRLLLSGTLAILALTNLASAIAPGYFTLLAIRVAMLAVGALYTPQAAGVASLIVPPAQRGGTMSYVFLGWSLAMACGLPAITYIASHVGWRAAYAAIGCVGALSCVLVTLRLPRGLFGAAVSLSTWVRVGRNPLILILLLITMLHTSGQFVVFTFMAPLLQRLAAASPGQVSIVFAAYGVCGLIGNTVASRFVDRWGSYRTSILFLIVLLAGVSLYALGAGVYALMATGVAVWGLGFASVNSMQQVRLVAADPPLAGATVSLNTSALYVGQAIGSAIGGMLFAAGWLHAAGFVAAAFVVLSLMTAIASGRLARQSAA